MALDGQSILANVAPPSSTSPAAGSDILKAMRKELRLPKDFRCHYDQAKGAFWSVNGRGEWCDYSEPQLKRLLRSHGVMQAKKDDGSLSDVEHALLSIQQHSSCHFAGEVAGYTPGMYDICGHRVLVVRGPRIPVPVQKPFPTLKTFISQLLGEEEKYLHAWLKSGLLSLKAGPPFRPGQMLAIAGKAGCGKSLMQDVLTEIFGGRSAKAYKFLTEKTEFNRDLFRAEHLVIEDDAASVDMRSRRHLAASVKQIVANKVHAFHPKGRDAIMLSPFWRMSFTLNNDADHLMVLPPLDDTLLDKVILLQANQATFPFSSDEPDGAKRFRQQLSAELPGYLWWLRRWPLPADLQHSRYGCRAYQNEELAANLRDMAPEMKLWTMLQGLGIVPSGYTGWEGTSTQLEQALIEKDRSGIIGRLLYFPTACGVYLASLEKTFPEHVTKLRTVKRVAVWRITIPPQETQLPE
jgi:hypothetical protein